MRARSLLAPALLALAACGLPGRTFEAPQTANDGRPQRATAMPVGEAEDEAFRAIPPAPLARPMRKAPEPVMARLANGVRVVTLERHDFPSVSIAFALDRGAAASGEGVAAVYAHALYGASAKYTARENAEYLRFVGATAQSHAWPDAVVLQTTALSPFWVSAIARVGPMFASPLLEKDDVEHARKAVIATRSAEDTTGTSLASDALLAELYPSPDTRGMPVFTRSPEVAEKVGQGAVESFRDQYLAASHVCVAAVGHFETAQMMRLLEKHLGGLPNKASRPEATDPPAARAPRIVVIDRPGAVQSNVMLGWYAPPVASKDATALDVLAAATGAGLSSRLNISVRKELGATYGVHMSVRSRRDGGSIAVGAAVETSRTAEVVQKLASELGRLRTESLAPGELAIAKAKTAYELDHGTSAGLATGLAHALAEGLPPSRVTERNLVIETLTGDDVRAAAARWMTSEARRIVVVGDASKVEGALRAANLGPVEIVR